MWRFLVILGSILLSNPASGLWSCSQDGDCASLSGSVCDDGNCVCPPGTQSVLGGTLCAEIAPYHTSTCVEDHQCSSLVTSFQCRRNNSEEGNCYCQPGFHYFLGRCWNSIDYGDQCTRDEECMSAMADPFSLTCSGTCGCADGYYFRQRGECRRIGREVGDGCVLDQDCQFQNAACNITSFRCYDTTAPPTEPEGETPANSRSSNMTRTARQHGNVCSSTAPCASPFVCSSFGVCICPTGYYASNDGSFCYADLGSPSTEEQCVGLFAEVRNGICTCQANFFYEENMRDCVKATRRITDSCVVDANCFTFGAGARCGAPQEPWFFRNCECIPELAIWDAQRNMCRLFVGIGESCEADSDCLAGGIEIQCVRNSSGEGVCTCPEGLTPVDGLCLTTGLALGDTCQVSSECTATEHTACIGDRCSCDAAYTEVDNYCAPVLSGSCAVDADCAIESSVCVSNGDRQTCQCRPGHVEEQDECWPVVSGHEAECTVSSQCQATLGEASRCYNNTCSCLPSYHHRDGRCWPMTGLFESCTRRSQCYLADMSDRVTCRNGLCQCDFDFPYSEELHTCLSSSTSVLANVSLVLAALIYLFSL